MVFLKSTWCVCVARVNDLHNKPKSVDQMTLELIDDRNLESRKRSEKKRENKNKVVLYEWNDLDVSISIDFYRSRRHCIVCNVPPSCVRQFIFLCFRFRICTFSYFSSFLNLKFVQIFSLFLSLSPSLGFFLSFPLKLNFARKQFKINS